MSHGRPGRPSARWIPPCGLPPTTAMRTVSRPSVGFGPVIGGVVTVCGSVVVGGASVVVGGASVVVGGWVAGAAVSSSSLPHAATATLKARPRTAATSATLRNVGFITSPGSVGLPGRISGRRSDAAPRRRRRPGGVRSAGRDDGPPTSRIRGERRGRSRSAPATRMSRRASSQAASANGSWSASPRRKTGRSSRNGSSPVCAQPLDVLLHDEGCERDGRRRARRAAPGHGPRWQARAAPAARGSRELREVREVAVHALGRRAEQRVRRRVRGERARRSERHGEKQDQRDPPHATSLPAPGGHRDTTLTTIPAE